jgi:hypothetical protein
MGMDAYSALGAVSQAIRLVRQTGLGGLVVVVDACAMAAPDLEPHAQLGLADEGFESRTRTVAPSGRDARVVDTRIVVPLGQ